MSARIVLGILIMMFLVTIPGKSGGKEDFQKFFNDAAVKVKASTDPVEKREILNKSLEAMSKAMDLAQNSPLISEGEIAGINRLKASVQEKQDELNGRNGYERVSDAQLNIFSDYVVQDMEQALETIHISLVALLLIIIIVILLV